MLLELILSIESLGLPALGLIGGSALIILLSKDWRLSVSALSVVYVGLFVLVARSWQLEVAVVKLVSGWIAASVLGLSVINLPNMDRVTGRYLVSEIIFRIAAAGLVGFAAWSLVDNAESILPSAYPEQIAAALLMIGFGILHLGFTNNAFQTILGLLLVWAGFELLFATVEDSIFVAGFMAVITLGLALGGAYLVIAPILEVEH
jgi:hypothetical protein